jgi:hypothetical protein
VRYDREYGYPIWANLDPRRGRTDDERFVRVTRFRVLDGGVTAGQGAADRSKPPIAGVSAGGFTVRRLSGPVAIDGRTWLAIDPIFGPKTVPARNGEFTISLTGSIDEGDPGRSRLTLVERGGQPVALAAGPVSYAYVTDDSRWILFEPLEVIDVRAWRRYSLGKGIWHLTGRRADRGFARWSTAGDPAPSVSVRLPRAPGRVLRDRVSGRAGAARHCG